MQKLWGILLLVLTSPSLLFAQTVDYASTNLSLNTLVDERFYEKQDVPIFFPSFIPPDVLATEVRFYDPSEGRIRTSESSQYLVNMGINYPYARRDVYEELFYQVILFSGEQSDYKMAQQVSGEVLKAASALEKSEQAADLISNLFFSSESERLTGRLTGSMKIVSELLKAGGEADIAEMQLVVSYAALSAIQEVRIELIRELLNKQQRLDPEMSIGFEQAVEQIEALRKEELEKIIETKRRLAAGESVSEGLYEIGVSGLVGQGIQAALGAGKVAAGVSSALPAVMVWALNRDMKREHVELKTILAATINEGLIDLHDIEQSDVNEAYKMKNKLGQMVKEMGQSYSKLLDPNATYWSEIKGRDYQDRADSFEYKSYDINKNYNVVLNKYDFSKLKISKRGDGYGLTFEIDLDKEKGLHITYGGWATCNIETKLKRVSNNNDNSSLKFNFDYTTDYGNKRETGELYLNNKNNGDVELLLPDYRALMQNYCGNRAYIPYSLLFNLNNLDEDFEIDSEIEVIWRKTS